MSPAEGVSMTTRDHAPVGAPCWTDLWTSDVEHARSFYSELFGWTALEPSPEFGGYFMFERDGVAVAGGMGDMGDMAANNSWKIYLSTDDVDKVAAGAPEKGAQLLGEPMPVADLGRQVVFNDPTGANLGAWQPGTFPGFTVLGEPGTPVWFELYTNEFDKAIDFYTSVFHFEVVPVSDTSEFRYVAAKSHDFGEFAGIFDAATELKGGRSTWFTYWNVADIDASTAHVAALGGKVLEVPADSPYGMLSTVQDPMGAIFKLHMSTHTS
jgi:uncharacterized protein